MRKCSATPQFVCYFWVLAAFLCGLYVAFELAGTNRTTQPLASANNARSLVYVGNLVDALILCAKHPAAAGQTYLVSDGEDVSTPDLLRQLGAAMGHPARLFPCPPALLKLAGG